MSVKPFDCVEMKREIQERLRDKRPTEPLDAWNEAVRAALGQDPHLRPFAEGVSDALEQPATTRKTK